MYYYSVYARVLVVPPNLYIHIHIYVFPYYPMIATGLCACTRVCWCRRIFTYIHTYMMIPARAHPQMACVRVYARVLVPPMMTRSLPPLVRRATQAS